MPYISSLYFQFRYITTLVKKIEKFKIKAIVKNNENNKNLNKINFTEHIPGKRNIELNKYLISLPQSLKNEQKLDFFSFSWLQKIGRTDLYLFIKENNLKFLLENYETSSKTLEKNYVRKITNSIYYKNKSKISLGLMIEEKMLTYSDKTELIIADVYKNVENAASGTNEKNFAKIKELRYIKINIIQFYHFNRSYKLNLCFLIYVFFCFFIFFN
jgi:hypothetical protein